MCTLMSSFKLLYKNFSVKLTIDIKVNQNSFNMKYICKVAGAKHFNQSIFLVLMNVMSRFTITRVHYICMWEIFHNICLNEYHSTSFSILTTAEKY